MFSHLLETFIFNVIFYIFYLITISFHCIKFLRLKFSREYTLQIGILVLLSLKYITCILQIEHLFNLCAASRFVLFDSLNFSNMYSKKKKSIYNLTNHNDHLKNIFSRLIF